MQQAGPFGHGGIQPQFGSHHARKERHLQRVVQHVLAVTGAVAQAAQQLHQLVVNAAQAHFQHGALALLLDGGLHFPAGLFHRLLNAGGMNAPVGNELLQRNAGHLPADRLKAGKGDGLWCVVNDQVHAREGFNGPDVPAFPADDPALHLVVGQGNYADGSFRHMVRRAALNGQGDDFPGGMVRLLLGLLLKLPDSHSLLVGQLVFQVVQQVFFCLVHREGRDFFQHVKLALFHSFGLFQPFVGLFVFLVDLVFLALHTLQLFLQAFLLLENAPFLVLNFFAPVVELFFRFVSQAMQFVFAFQYNFLFLSFGGFDGVCHNPLGLLLGGADFRLRLVLAVVDAQKKGDYAGGSGS